MGMLTPSPCASVVNLEKINFHGRRADVIVKGMLQHSRNNTGTKELTGPNELADEYLRMTVETKENEGSVFTIELPE